MTAGSRLAALVVVALASIHLWPHAIAHAQPTPSAADEAFRQGRELIKAGKYAEACVEFEKSQKLDPQLGTLFNLAQCSEKIGKLATAASAYRELVARDTNDTRKGTSARELASITPRIPKLFVKIVDPPAGLKLSLDGKAGSTSVPPNLTTEVDIGDFQLVAKAKGYEESISKVKMTESKTTTIEVTLEPIAGAGGGEEDEPPRRSSRKLFGIGAVAAGGAVLIGGIVVGSLARSTWNDAKAVCGGSCTTAAEVDRANALADKARSKATLSTVLSIGGGVLAAVGVVLWVTAPSGVQITPTVSDGGAGVTFAGAF